MRLSFAIGRVVMGAVLLVAGCGERTTTPAPADALLPDAWIELRRVRPELRSYPNSILLDFEKPTDRVFVATTGTSATIDTAQAHSGAQSLHAFRAPSVDIKLSSVMSGRALPGEWTLLGAYILSDRQTPLQVQYLVDGKPVLTKTQPLARGVWTPAMLDITTLSPTLIANQTVILRFTPATPAELWLDDVMLINNSETMVSDGAWRVSQSGLRLTIEHDDVFRLDFDQDPARKDLWSLAEASRLRAVMALDYPNPVRWVIYRHGPRYRDGAYEDFAQLEHIAAFAEQHRAPASVEIAEEQGSLNRRSPGDANNDGYNEVLGAYMVTATKPRIDVRITPRTSQLIQPVIQIRGLPEGKIVATLEGQLIDQVDRLEDGTVLVIPAHRIQRPVTLNVRVQ